MTEPFKLFEIDTEDGGLTWVYYEWDDGMISRTKVVTVLGEVTESTNRVVAGGELMLLKMVIDLEERVGNLEDALAEADIEY